MRTWSIADIPSAQQEAYWCDVLCQAFTALDTNPLWDRSVRSSRESRVESKSFCNVEVSHLHSYAQAVTRGVHEIRRAPPEYFFANLQVIGRCLVRQDGREFVADAGDLYVVDTTRPYELTQQQDDWHTIACRVPRDRLLPMLRTSHAITAVNLTSASALGRVSATAVSSMSECPDSVSIAAQDVLATNLMNLLAVTVGSTPEAAAQGQSAVRDGIRDAIIRHVQANLGDPALSVETVALKFRISPRYLHKLFEESGQSFGQMVRDLRLTRRADELASGACRSVSDLAFRWGFMDFSHFCRAFRRRFGESATDYRKRLANEQSGADAASALPAG